MVRLVIGDINSLIEDLTDKKLVCYGAGKNFDQVMIKYKHKDLIDKVDCIIDNNEELQSTFKDFDGNKRPIISLNDFVKNNKIDNYVILITIYNDYLNIIEQLDNYSELCGIHLYVGSFLHIKFEKNDFSVFKEKNVLKIPKVIHYCWFGGNKIPDEYNKYMESWKKYCTDYEIIRWDESNYDVTKNKYMHEAYIEKKWAFVSDYARIDIVNKYGGIYLDCDVELLKSWDLFLVDDFFAGFEDNKYIDLGLGFGAIAGHEYLVKLLDLYESLEFRKGDTLNMVPCTVYQSMVLEKMGFKMNNTFQKINNMVIYPSNIFSPITFYGMGEVDLNTYSIHHYSSSWHTEIERKYIQEFKERGQLLYQRYLLNE
ncbi:MAG: glycosyltransferase family 32 protein [Lachnospirales bacterium]